MGAREHWERIYDGKTLEQMSWHRDHLETSLALIERVAGDRSAAIIDVGGGASTLVDDLLARGYRNVTVLDISQPAIEIAKNRLGDAAGLVRWLNADVTGAVFPRPSFSNPAQNAPSESGLPQPAHVRRAGRFALYDVWHDRAVFHFLTKPEERKAYVRNVLSAVKPGGHVIVATFGPEGPNKCSGLDVMRYDAVSLTEEFGARFHPIESFTEMHRTPAGTTQQFLYCVWALEGSRH